MKKGTIIAIIVAVCLIFAGGILLALGLSFADQGAPEDKLIRQEITIEERFDSISIDTEECDVKFAMFSGRDDCMVEIRTHERAKHSAVVEDGTLRIEMIDERNWTDYIGIFHLFGRRETMEMTVYLPTAEYESLQVRTQTGDITLSQEPAFREAVLRSETGDISCAVVSGDVLDCMTATGDISVQNSAATLTTLHSSTGDLSIFRSAGDEIHIMTDTGEVEVQNVTGQIFICSSATGDVELEGVVVADYLQVSAATGDVEIQNCDAQRVNIETDTGDVSGHFLTAKWFSAHSDTGSVRVPNTREGGECRIESNTGDIRFE